VSRTVNWEAEASRKQGVRTTSKKVLMRTLEEKIYLMETKKAIDFDFSMSQTHTTNDDIHECKI